MMSTVTRTPASIARSGATPAFVELCKALYGDTIDPDEVWDDVIKRSPDQADQSAAGQRKQAQAAFASNAFGSAMGGLAIKDAVRTARGKMGAGKLVPTKAKVAAGLIAAGQIANVGGDVNSGVVTGRQAFGRQKPEKVGKAGGGKLVPLKDMTVGHIKHAEVIRGQVLSSSDLGYMPTSSKLGPASPSPAKPAGRGRSLAYRAGRLTSRTLSTPEGRAGMAAGAVAGSGTTAAAGRRRSGGGSQYEDYVGKADDSVVFKGIFTEVDEEQRTAFGWASVTELAGQPVVDRQGDYITTEDIEKAAYDYVHKSRVGGDMHRRTQSAIGDSAHKVSDMIESVVFTDEKISKMGLPNDFPRGWWVGFKIHDDETWNLVKSGERTGFSIHGKGIRKDLELDTLMGYQ